MQFFGRRVILSDASTIDRANVRTALASAMRIHSLNRAEIDYLHRYWRGQQPIRDRVKPIRPEINNKIVENRANQIVSFKTGYQCGEPIQYIGRNSNGHVAKDIQRLNEIMAYENKAGNDRDLIEWGFVCGTAYRMALPDKSDESDETPFEIYTPDPRNTFVVYSSSVARKPLMCVTYTQNPNTGTPSVYSIYTPSRFFEIVNGQITQDKAHYLGTLPIIEYPANTARLGCFEIVLPLLDAINSLDSNRLDGVEQFIQSFIRFVNCEISEEKYEEFRAKGAIMVKSAEGSNASVDIVSSELSQDQTQTLKNDLYQNVLTICGMPNRNGGSSTSDTGAAVIMRDGWEDAEARAKDSEIMFKASEREFLKLILLICRNTGDWKLSLRDIDIKFTRRNYEAIQSKSQVLVQMLGSNKIAPNLAFEHCGMFADPDNAYMQSARWIEENAVSVEKQERTAVAGNAERVDNPPPAPAG